MDYLQADCNCQIIFYQKIDAKAKFMGFNRNHCDLWC